ncbi:MAG TPA: MBL fold metallo-hydrolase, partial [Acidobacteriota bacterium]|nr:MBL fold metallo-hydrolase [Acidobacteriota bacterium]
MQKNNSTFITLTPKIFFIFILLSTAFAAQNPKVVVIGIAQDGGIPQIGCTQEICRTTKHFVSSLALIDETSVFLIDATPDLRVQYSELTKRYPNAAKQNLFDGILLTHAHIGHYSGLLYLGKESISTKQVPVWCSSEMSEYLTHNQPWSLLVTNGNITLRTFESGKTIQMGSFSVTPIAVPHRKEFTDTHGFIIRNSRKSLLYIPDIDSWEPVREKMIELFSKNSYALLDGTFYSGNELPGRNMKLVPHPTIESSLAFFKTFPPFQCKIYFTHLNHTNPLLDPKTAESVAFK